MPPVAAGWEILDAEGCRVIMIMPTWDDAASRFVELFEFTLVRDGVGTVVAVLPGRPVVTTFIQNLTLGMQVIEYTLDELRRVEDRP
jgi:hypothetical protein